MTEKAEKTITVVAIAEGFDNLVVRKVGDVFEMPATVFDLRPRFDANGKPIQGQFHEPPSWFEPLDEKEKQRVRKQRDEHDNLLMPVNPAQQEAAHDIANQKIADDEARAAQQAKEARGQKAQAAKK